MAGKKLPQNVDLASNVEVAAGFFTDTPPAESKAETDKKNSLPHHNQNHKSQQQIRPPQRKRKISVVVLKKTD